MPGSQMRVWEASRVQTLGLNGGWSPETRYQEKPQEKNKQGSQGRCGRQSTNKIPGHNGM